jgi:S-adenosylmethionine/arginine decarboxylase-like enzyme
MNSMTLATPVLPRTPPASPPPPIRYCDSAQRMHAVWRDCRQAVEGLRNADTLKNLCLRICDDLHLNVAGNAFFQFEPTGVAGTILLNGSHIAIHTWPDRHMLKANIHLQNSNEDSKGAALALLEQLKFCFQPAHSSMGRTARPTKFI